MVLLIFFEYGVMVEDFMKGLDLEFIFELGCMIVGNVGCFILKVFYVKIGVNWNFFILDVVMNDLICFVFYDVYYDIFFIIEFVGDVINLFFDVVGLVCEIGDIFVCD